MRLIIAIIDLSALLAGVAIVCAPYLSRPGIFFGKTVPVGFSKTPEGRAILSRYRTSAVILSALWIIAVHLLMLYGYAAGIFASSLMLMIGAWSIWMTAHRKVPANTSEPPSLSTPSLEVRDSMPGSWLFAAGPFLVLALAGCVLYLNWESIPQRFPTHWGLNGQADGWGRRTVGDLAAPLVIGAVQSLTMIVVAYWLMTRTRQVAAGGAAADREHGYRRTSALVMIVIAYVLSIMFAIIGTRPVWSSNGERLDVMLVLAPFVTVIAVIALVGYMVYAHQRAVMTAPAGTQPSGDGTPDECWKWGIFYYNPDDPAVLVEKRVGIGWTFNFANKSSWVLLGLILLFAFVPVLIALLA